MLTNPLRDRFGSSSAWSSTAPRTWPPSSPAPPASSASPSKPRRDGNRPPRTGHAADRQSPAAAGARLRPRCVGRAYHHDIASRALDLMDVDAQGFDHQDRRLLPDHDRQVSTAVRWAVDSLAAAISEEVTPSKTCWKLFDPARLYHAHAARAGGDPACLSATSDSTCRRVWPRAVRPICSRSMVTKCSCEHFLIGNGEASSRVCTRQSRSPSRRPSSGCRVYYEDTDAGGIVY